MGHRVISISNWILCQLAFSQQFEHTLYTHTHTHKVSGFQWYKHCTLCTPPSNVNVYTFPIKYIWEIWISGTTPPPSPFDFLAEQKCAIKIIIITISDLQIHPFFCCCSLARGICSRTAHTHADVVVNTLPLHLPCSPYPTLRSTHHHSTVK